MTTRPVPTLRKFKFISNNQFYIMVHFARGMKQTTIINSNDSRQSVCFYNYVYSTFLHIYTHIYIYITHHTFMTQTDLIKGFVRLHPISRNMHHSPTHKKYTFYTCYFLSKSHMKTLIYREFSSPCEAMKNCGLYS